MNHRKRSSAISLGLIVCLLSLIASPGFAAPDPQAAKILPAAAQVAAMAPLPLAGVEQPTELSEAQMAEVRGEWVRIAIALAMIVVALTLRSDSSSSAGASAAGGAASSPAGAASAASGVK